MKILKILVALCLMCVTSSFGRPFDGVYGYCPQVEDVFSLNTKYKKSAPESWVWCDGANFDGPGCSCPNGKHLKKISEGTCSYRTMTPDYKYLVTKSDNITHWKCENDSDNCPPNNEMDNYQQNTPGYKVWCDGADAHFDGHACSCLNGKKLKKIFDGQCDGVTMMRWQCE